MRIRWRGIGAVAAAIAALAVIAPNALATALPVLVVAACLLSMVLMGWNMSHISAHADRAHGDDHTATAGRGS